MPICKSNCWADINTRWMWLAKNRHWHIDVGSELIDQARADGSWTSNNQVQAPTVGSPPHPVTISSEIFEEKRPPRTELYWEEKDRTYKRINHDERRYSIQKPDTNFFRTWISWFNFR